MILAVWIATICAFLAATISAKIIMKSERKRNKWH